VPEVLLASRRLFFALTNQEVALLLTAVWRCLQRALDDEGGHFS
jgi:hypothetical protein